MTFVFAAKRVAAVLVAAAALSACSTGATSDHASSEALVVVTHESFDLPVDLKEQFAAEHELDVTYVAPGDAGALVNQLILTKDTPLGDVVFGIDNTFSARALEAGIISEEGGEALVAVDFGDVCINADLEWFEDNDLAVPDTLDDLTDPDYEDLLVVSNPASSSPGLAFLIASIGAKGEDGWLDYWDGLVANGAKIVPGWSDAYHGEFSGGEGDGTRPLVVSYSSSPAFTLTADAASSTTAALPGTCFRQTEYAGVIEGASNPDGARQFIDFLLSAEVQAAIPDAMYMYPVDDDVQLPEAWAEFAPLATDPIQVAEEEISANRDDWLETWTEHVIG